MKLTRHAAMSMFDINEIPEDQVIELDDEISDYLWPLLGDFQETYSPFALDSRNVLMRNGKRDEREFTLSFH